MRVPTSSSAVAPSRRPCRSATGARHPSVRSMCATPLRTRPGSRRPRNATDASTCSSQRRRLAVRRFEAGSPRYFQAITEINFLSAAVATRAAFPALRAASGSVINITSISARRPSPGTAVYGAAKAALESLTRSSRSNGRRRSASTRSAAAWCTPRARSTTTHTGAVRGDRTDHPAGATGLAAGARQRLRHARLTPVGAHTGAVVPVDGGGEWPAFLSHTPNADIVQQADRLDITGGSSS